MQTEKEAKRRFWSHLQWGGKPSISSPFHLLNNYSAKQAATLQSLYYCEQRKPLNRSDGKPQVTWEILLPGTILAPPLVLCSFYFCTKKKKIMHKGTCPEKDGECCWLTPLMIPQTQRDTNSSKNSGYEGDLRKESYISHSRHAALTPFHRCWLLHLETPNLLPDSAASTSPNLSVSILTYNEDFSSGSHSFPQALRCQAVSTYSGLQLH